ncbi:coiled-coil domain-containing protein 17 [Hemitrygon akajei]|uniref:coiled-coil domain-containing protein 17 n=1 Tax=Hemitrygon akajei TaxID=2704970 RepID=UPI003BF99DA5
MVDSGNFHCHNCNMNFRSLGLLEKHKDKFCIGSCVEDSFLLNENPRNSLPGNHGNKISRINETRKINIPNHMERELKLPQFRQPEDSLSDSRAFRKLTDEFHKLQMSIEGSLPTYRSWQEESEVSPRVQREWEHLERVREISEMHGRYLADIQARNRELEEQREEIHQRLEELSSKEHFTIHIEQMLLELKAKEEKNQQSLDALREQIEHLHMDTVVKQNSVKVSENSSVEKKEHKVPFPVVSFSSSESLSAEIGALKLLYLQNGGNDPAILAQMNGLQTEAQLLEKSIRQPKEKKKKHEPPHKSLDAELLAVELENQLLEDEILKLKFQRERRKPVDELEKEVQEMQREHINKMSDLQGEIEMLKSETHRMRRGLRSPHHMPQHPLPPPPPPPPPPPQLGPNQHAWVPHMGTMRPQTPLIAKHFLDPTDALGPAPYDPVAGFVVFYDFLLGLDPTYRLIRLVTGLYNNGQEMGKPSALPAVCCEMGNGPHYMSEGLKGNFGILSARQPVPRVHPAFGISLVFELQAAGGFDLYGLEIQRLVSRGWAKIDIFDNHNQVISGRWKVPIRSLPVNPSLNTSQLNGIPQVGSAELYLRLVNARDAEVQSMASIDPHSTSMYQYPPLVAGRSVPPAENLPPPQYLSYHTSPAHYHPLTSHTGHVDLPPNDGRSDLRKSNQRLDDESNLVVQTAREQDNENVLDKALVLIVDRVKGAPNGDGSLRFTGYHQRTGKVIDTRNSGLLWSTTSVKSNIKQGYFIFGEQEMSFYDVMPEEDMILIIRFYHWPDGNVTTAPWDINQSMEQLMESEEWLVAWGVLKLSARADSCAMPRCNRQEYSDPSEAAH